VFFAMQAFKVVDLLKDKYDHKTVRIYVLGIAGLIGSMYIGFLLSIGELGSLSARVRSLFIAHTKTGNPLVDSVAEHQATPPHYYFQYFHYIVYFALVGFAFLFVNRSNAKLFGILYCIFSYYFSQKMVRLILILSPAASMVSGYAIWLVILWTYNNLISLISYLPKNNTTEDKTDDTKKDKTKSSNQLVQSLFKVAVGIVFLLIIMYCLSKYYNHAEMLSEQLSEPQIILRSRRKDGTYEMVDDFREAYWWLRDNTPKDARIMSWWDYGYQINGIANRTTIADGNTWNHEHIALLGKCLVSKEEDAWKIARHLADYVLVWSTRFAGMPGDDAAKMPHMANIAGSVFS